MKYALIAALLIALSGCASIAPSPAADNRVAKGFLPPPQGSLVILLPEPKSKDFSKGEAMLAKQLHRQLTAAGYKAAILDATNYDELWREEVAAVGGIYDPVTGALRHEAYASATSALAKRICDELKCALVVRQRFLARKASLEGMMAQWDGQQRHIPVSQGGVSKTYSFSGSTYGISVELLAIAGDGAFAFRMYGGVSLPYQTNIHEVRNEIRPDLFSDDKEIADGVRIALGPLLTR